MTYISDVFLTTLMYVLIDDGSAILPPIGRRHVERTSRDD